MPLVKWIKQKRRSSVAAAAAVVDRDKSVGNGRASSAARRRKSHDTGGGLQAASKEVKSGSLGIGEVPAEVAYAAVERQRSRSFDPAAVDPSVGSEAAAAALKIMVAYLSLPFSHAFGYPISAVLIIHYP